MACDLYVGPILDYNAMLLLQAAGWWDKFWITMLAVLQWCGRASKLGRSLEAASGCPFIEF